MARNFQWYESAGLGFDGATRAHPIEFLPPEVCSTFEGFSKRTLGRPGTLSSDPLIAYA
jgi:hypothetical protein